VITLSLIRYLKKVSLIVFSYLPSEIKILFYHCMGAEIGKDVDIGLGSYIIPFDDDFKKIHIGDGVTIGDGVHILCKKLFLGTQSQIKDNTRIWGQSDFIAGKGTYIDTECHFDLRRTITLGEDIAISGGSWLYTHMACHSVLEGALSKFGPITVEDRTYFGSNVFVLPDITIGHDSTIGARAVVTKNVIPDSVMVGNPARDIAKTSQKIKKLTTDDKINLIKEILFDFMHVYNEKIIRIKEWNTKELIFSFRDQIVLYIPDISGPLEFQEKTKEYSKPITLISWSIPDEIITECNKNSISWFEMKSGAASLKSNKNDRIIGKFFGNYGIKFLYCLDKKNND
jgi:acetyltransferase-like isoleucine patch superfamily enzyme